MQAALPEWLFPVHRCKPLLQQCQARWHSSARVPDLSYYYGMVGVLERSSFNLNSLAGFKFKMIVRA